MFFYTIRKISVIRTVSDGIFAIIRATHPYLDLKDNVNENITGNVTNNDDDSTTDSSDGVNNIPVNIDPPKIEYEDKYKDRLAPFAGALRKYKDIPDPIHWRHLENTQLLEPTPFGNVLMYYDSSKDTFIYYSDRALTYGIVDSVARRYVLINNCTLLYFDVSSEDSFQQEETVVVNGPTAISRKAFAKFKSYNKPKQEVVKYRNHKINRYTYGGKLVNFMFLKKTPTVQKVFSYADFKKSNKHTKHR